MFIPHQLRRVRLAHRTSLSPPVIHYWSFKGGGSDMVSVSCFGVRVSVMFHFMCVHYTFSSVWVAEQTWGNRNR